MDETDSLKLPYILPSQAQKHVTHNEALTALDAAVQLAVLDRDATAPPGEPAAGERHIVGAGAAGAWAGQDHRLAVRRDGNWFFIAPNPGWRAWVADEQALVVWNGDAWIDIGNTLSRLQHLERLGLGTEADADNPFAAKLGKALWTARDVAEGGSGDLRYTFNKEDAQNVLSLLMQSGWSGRAEIGLVGDDDLSFKVSPDGSDWVEAVRIKSQDGATRFNAPMSVRADAGLGVDIDLEGGSGVFQATRYIDSPAAPVFFGRKARGTRDEPAAVQAGDTLIGFRGYGHTGQRFISAVDGVAFLLEAAEDFVDNAAYGTQMRFFTTATGSTTLDERLRIADSGDLQMGGANTVIGANRHPVLRSYPVAGLPAPSPEGQLIFVSDGASNRHLAVSDGTDWRWPDGGLVT